MTNAEKVALAREAKDRYGLAPVLAALELPRSSWYYNVSRRRTYTEKYAHLRQPLEVVARSHPGYGYRRSTTELQEAHGYPVNHKVVQRLHQEWGLPLMRSVRPPRPSGIRQVIEVAGDRVNLVAGREKIGPFEVLYTDFTEIVYANGRKKAYLMPVLDHAGKMVTGWAMGERAVTDLALEAWEEAKKTLSGYGVKLDRVTVHHDQDPVYTGYRWAAQLLLKDAVSMSFALAGARDNPEMESFNGHFKTENRSLLLDAETFTELQKIVAERMDYYNEDRRHSSIGNRSPKVFVMTQWQRSWSHNSRC